MTTRANKFLWNIHTTLIEKTFKPGSREDQEFLALSLCGEAGEFANLIKKRWRGDDIPDLDTKLQDEMGDIYAYLLLNAAAHGWDLDYILHTITLPKIEARWGAQEETPGNAGTPT